MRIAFAFDPADIDSRSASIVGRQIANEGLFRAFLKYVRPAEIGIVTYDECKARTIRNQITALDNRLNVREFSYRDPSLFSWADAVYHPSPFLTTAAKSRRCLKNGSPSARLIGITHSLSTSRVLKELRNQQRELNTSDWLVCTSRSASKLVKSVPHIGSSVFGPRITSRGATSTIIPLGFHEEDFANLGAPDLLRKEMRRRVQANPEDLVILYFGRLNYLTKAHLSQTFIACLSG